MGKDQRDKPAEAHPFLLKLAIPLALSLAGFLISTLTRNTRNTQIQEEEEQMDYAESFSRYEFEEEATSTSLQHLEGTNEREEATLKEEMEDLKSLVACLEEREGELESQFNEYSNLKDQESAFQKIQITCLGLKLESLNKLNNLNWKTSPEISATTETIHRDACFITPNLGNSIAATKPRSLCSCQLLNCCSKTSKPVFMSVIV